MATDLAEAGDKGEQVMDTFTNDERREVADSLRARAAGVGFAYHDVYGLNDGWAYRTLLEIVEAIGCAENPHPAEWMARLADLIDPTCAPEAHSYGSIVGNSRLQP